MSTTTHTSRWDRFGLAAGLGFVILILTAAFIAPMPPEADSVSSLDVGWFEDNRSILLVQVFVRAVAAILQLVFIAAIVTMLRRLEGGISTFGLLVLAGGITHTIMLLIANAGTATATHVASEGGSSETVYTLQSLGMNALTLEAMAGAMLIFVTSVALLRTRSVPRAIGWLGLAGTPIYIIGAASFPGTSIEGIGFAALFVELIWFGAVSVTLAMRGRDHLVVPQSQAAPA